MWDEDLPPPLPLTPFACLHMNEFQQPTFLTLPCTPCYKRCGQNCKLESQYSISRFSQVAHMQLHFIVHFICSLTNNVTTKAKNEEIEEEIKALYSEFHKKNQEIQNLQRLINNLDVQVIINNVLILQFSQKS